MKLYEFEKMIADKVGLWNPTALSKNEFSTELLGSGKLDNKNMRLLIAFSYTGGSEDGTLRASLGDTYQQRVAAEAIFDLFAGQTQTREIQHNLFQELHDFCRSNMDYEIDNYDSGYVGDSHEFYLRLILSFNLDTQVRKG